MYEDYQQVTEGFAKLSDYEKSLFAASIMHKLRVKSAGEWICACGGTYNCPDRVKSDRDPLLSVIHQYLVSEDMLASRARKLAPQLLDLIDVNASRRVDNEQLPKELGAIQDGLTDIVTRLDKLRRLGINAGKAANDGEPLA